MCADEITQRNVVWCYLTEFITIYEQMSDGYTVNI